MEVRVEGNGQVRTWTVEDGGMNGDSSMARTTGLVTFACVVAWSQQELFTEAIPPPEDLPSEVINEVIQTLKDEGVRIEMNSEKI